MKKTFLIISALLILAVALIYITANFSGYTFPSPGVEDAAADPSFHTPANHSGNSLILNDPEIAYRNIPATKLKESKVVFSKEQIEQIPTGGHYQGIQCYTSDQKNYMYLSHDSDKIYPYFVIAEQSTDYRWDVRKNINIEYDENGLPNPLKHAGGIQICNHYLAVGIEDNRGKKDSQIIFYDISDPLNPLQLSNLTIKRSSSEEKAKTAGAVALIDYVIDNNDGYLTAVANWDSKDIDLYFLEGDLNHLNTKEYKSKPFFTWKSEEADRSTWKPDKKWGSYQSINFVKDNDCNLYLLCTHTSGKVLGIDFIDLFSVTINEDNSVEITKLNKKHMHMGIYQPLSNNAHYIYGGGIFVQDADTLVSLATARNISKDYVKIIISPSIYYQKQ